MDTSQLLRLEVETAVPVVSVVLPTYNRAAFLREAIESVRAQTFQDWELLVVDDGSTDDTAVIVQEFARRDRRIRNMRQANGGLHAARNTGLRAASGRYMTFLDDDDLLLPNKLAHQVPAMEARPELGFLYSPVWLRSDDGKPDRCIPPRLGNTFAALFENCLPQVHGVLVRRSCLDAVGLFDEQHPYAGDYDLWLRLASRFPFDYTTEPVGIYRHHRGNMSREPLEAGRQLLATLRSVRGTNRLGVSPWLRRRRLANLAYGVARRQIEAGDYPQAARHFLQAILWRPDIGFLVHEYDGGQGQSALRKAVKPYAGALYCLWRGVVHANG
jgi:glycosyltransferase involved in cell wall biosynthesis